MNKLWITRLYVIGLILGMCAAPLIVFSFLGSTFHAVDATHIVPTALGHPQLFVLGVILASFASLVIAVAWIGALLKIVQLQRWGWFVFLLLFSGIGLLGYVLLDQHPSEPHPHL